MKSLTTEPDPLEAIDFERALAAVRRQLRLIAVFGVLGGIVGVAYVATAVRLYTSTADVLVDKRQPRAVSDMSNPEDNSRSDAEMGSQVALLLSDHMARAVVNRLNLTENPAFNAEEAGFFDAIKSLVRDGVDYVVSSVMPSMISDSELEANQEDKVRDAASELRDGVVVSRVDESYVLRISYTSADPVLAAAIANAYGAAYLDDQLQAKYESTRRASAWLQGRIGELKAQSIEADLAVQRFRNENGLLSTGNQLVSEQQLGEINAQLISAQASTAEAKARLDQLRGIIASGRTDAVVNDALASTPVINLRSKYLEASRLEAEITRKLGPDHAQSKRLRDEMKEYSRLMFSELSRIAESYESTYNVALRREQSLQESLQRVSGISQDANTSGVKLRELQQEAETYRTLYNNFLQRYQEAVQQQSFPMSDSRVITDAEITQVPTFPRTKLVIALSAVLGLGFGIGIGAFREYRDRFFRTGSQVRSELDLEYLGSLKKIKGSVKPPSGGGVEPDKLWRPGSINAYVKSHPFSAFAETLRNVKVAIDLHKGDAKCKVIGVVSCLPSEGKTVTASNLASIFAFQGSRVLLIDADLRNPSLSRNLLQQSENGLIEVVLGAEPFAACAQVDQKLSVLPLSITKRIPNSSEFLSSRGMEQLLTAAKTAFDYIIVDLPPLGAVVDAKAFAHRVDCFVQVVEWGKTSRGLVRNTLMANVSVRDKCVGVVFNKEDESKSKFYRSHEYGDYYSSQYSDYYRG